MLTEASPSVVISGLDEYDVTVDIDPTAVESLPNVTSYSTRAAITSDGAASVRKSVRMRAGGGNGSAETGTVGVP